MYKDVALPCKLSHLQLFLQVHIWQISHSLLANHLVTKLMLLPKLKLVGEKDAYFKLGKDDDKVMNLNLKYTGLAQSPP
jgi:hypothetical protein